MAEKLITKLRDFPAVEELLQKKSLSKAIASIPRPIAAGIIKEVVAGNKKKLREKKTAIMLKDLELEIAGSIRRFRTQEMTRVINATGIVVHTNLGRAPLDAELFDEVRGAVAGYGNIEYDLTGGSRGRRGGACERYLAAVAQAEAGTIVNNNAAALLLILNSLANRKEVVISRGELVQIGGGFRIPDILRKSGGRLREVGTTNITTLSDYREAITDRTGLILKVHKSNFAQSGFTDEVDIASLVKLGREHDIPVVNDLGSGVFIPTKKLLGHAEPTVQSSVKSGAHLTCFSGDKMLGGVQSGLIAGKAEEIARLKRNPLFRTMRLDKIMVGFLERLLKIYLDGNPTEQIKLWRILSTPEAALYERGRRIIKKLGEPDDLTVSATEAFVGGGALPDTPLPSVGLVFGERYNAAGLMRVFREMQPPVIGRIANERFVLDLKAVDEAELDLLTAAVRQAIE